MMSSIRRFTGICFWKQHSNSYLQTTNSLRFISNNVPLIISREQYCDGKYLKISVCVIKNDQNNCTLRRHFHRKNNNAEEKKKPARQRLVFLDFYFKIKIHIF